jgi:gliding motility-associated-like protein
LPFLASVVPTNVSCFNGADGQIEAFGLNGVEPFDYSWNTGDTTKVVTGLTPGFFAVTITDAVGRTSDNSGFVLQPDTIVIEFSSSPPSCTGVTGSVSISNITGGTAPYQSYQWSNGDTGISITGLTTGTYIVTITDGNGCTVSASQDIIASIDQLIIDTIIEHPFCNKSGDGSITLIVLGGTPPYNYTWDYYGLVDQDPIINDSLATLLDDGIFFVSVTDQNKCGDTLRIELVPKHKDCLYVPSGFTPNNDGYNDTWEILNIDMFPEAKIFVFNRWRKVVFSKDGNYENDWDGTYEGKPLPMDTYHYIIKLSDEDDPITGQITIMR